MEGPEALILKDGKTGDPLTLARPIGPPAPFVVRHYVGENRFVEVGPVDLPAEEAAEANRALVHTNFRLWPRKKKPDDPR